MSHTITDRKPLLARVRRMRGQVDALERALDAGSDCASVLQQVAAVRGAANGLMAQILEGHIREHLGGSESSDARAQDLEAVVGAVRSYLK